MEAEDPLSQLADIHLPIAVPAWPPAPGWWLLAAVLLLGLVLLAWVRFRQWQQQQRLGRALQELEQALARWNDADANLRNTAGLALLQAVNHLLKRVALQHYPTPEVAPLTGDAWLRFLDASGHTQEFSAGPGKVLAEGEYRRHFDADTTALCTLARQWIRIQYRQPPAGRAAAGKAQSRGLTA